MSPKLLPVEPDAVDDRSADADPDRVETEASARIASGLASIRRRFAFMVAVSVAGVLAAAHAFWQGHILIGLVLALPVAGGAWYFILSPVLTHRPWRPHGQGADETPEARSFTRD